MPAHEIPYSSRLDSRPRSVVYPLVPLLLGFTAGSGGMVTPQGIAVMERWLQVPQIQMDRPMREAEVVDTISPAEHLARIRDQLALNLSELATLLGVTRPTVYAWLNGKEPRPEALIKIRKLSGIANDVASAAIPRMDTLIRRPMFAGRSLIDLLAAGDLPDGAVAVLRDIADREAAARQVAKGSSATRRSLADAAGDVAPADWSEG